MTIDGFGGVEVTASVWSGRGWGSHDGAVGVGGGGGRGGGGGGGGIAQSVVFDPPQPPVEGSFPWS